MVIKHITPFNGQHCETTSTGTLLNNLGITLSEPMLFGLGEGLGFIFWNMKIMDFPFIGGRVKPDQLTRNLITNLNLELEVKETTSVKKAWENVRAFIDDGVPVGLKLDSYHLDYFTTKIHFAGHYAALCGYDDEYAHLVDTAQQGGRMKTSLKSLELARNEKGPMSSNNLSYTIKKTSRKFDLEKTLKRAIRNNAKDFLNPPISNIGYKGIAKTAVEIRKWFKSSSNISRDFTTTAVLMEKAGTGGSLFRNLYRDFLKESSQLLESDLLTEAHLQFSQIAAQWKKISVLLDKAGKTGEINFIDQASEILTELAVKEKNAMELLLKGV